MTSKENAMNYKLQNYAKNMFKMNEGSGSHLLDSVGNGIGIISGASWINGGGLSFDGVKDYVTIDKKIKKGEKSVYVVFTPFSGGFIITNTDGVLPDGFFMQVTTNNKLRVAISKNSSYIFDNNSIADIVIGQEYKILVCWDGTINKNSLKVYINDFNNPFYTSQPSDTETLNDYPNSTVLASRITKNTFFKANYREISLFDRDISKGVNILLILNNGEYYYHNKTNWISIGNNISLNQILNYGMKSISKLHISEFESIYGSNWCPIKWTDGDVTISAKLLAIPKPQILTAKSSAEFSGVESAEFKWLASGNARVAISINDGLTYHAYRNGEFIDVSDDISQGMTPTEYGSWTQEEFDQFRGDSNFIKHKYYLPDGAEIDDILIKANMKGHNELAKGHTINYDQSTKTITIDINKSGTYYASYVDV